jgi:hypothetical protein
MSTSHVNHKLSCISWHDFSQLMGNNAYDVRTLACQASGDFGGGQILESADIDAPFGVVACNNNKVSLFAALKQAMLDPASFSSSPAPIASDQSSHSQSNGACDFVWLNTKLRIGNSAGHPGLAKSYEEVNCAGECSKNDTEIFFRFKSGHYKPKDEDCLLFLANYIYSSCLLSKNPWETFNTLANIPHDFFMGKDKYDNDEFTRLTFHDLAEKLNLRSDLVKDIHDKIAEKTSPMFQIEVISHDEKKAEQPIANAIPGKFEQLKSKLFYALEEIEERKTKKYGLSTEKKYHYEKVRIGVTGSLRDAIAKSTDLTSIESAAVVHLAENIENTKKYFKDDKILLGKMHYKTLSMLPPDAAARIVLAVQVKTGLSTAMLIKELPQQKINEIFPSSPKNENMRHGKK